MPDVTQAPAPDSLFEDHTVRVVERLRSALVSVLASVPGASAGGPSELAADLEIDKTLAWRIVRVMSGEDSFSAARYVPGPSAFRTFIRAAKERGASKGALASATAGFHNFQELIADHAGNRRMFDLMLAGHAVEERARADLECRRGNFETGSYIWGAQVRVTLGLRIMAPAADPRLYDCAFVRGFIDLRRVRPNVAWRLPRAYMFDNSGAVLPNLRREILSAQSAADGIPEGLALMPEFCSHPLPRCRRIDLPLGLREFELVESAVGNTGLLTCVTGEVVRCAETRYRTPEISELSQNLTLRTPTELAIYDVMIHRDLFLPRRTPDFALCSNLFFTDPMNPHYRPADRLPVQEQIRALGTAAAPPETPEVPNYAGLVQHVFQRCGWQAGEFEVFRVTLRYPPIPTTMVVTHPFCDAPAGG
jgi:hypothetical protein